MRRITEEVEEYKTKYEIEKEEKEELKKEVKKIEKWLTILAAKVHVKLESSEESEDWGGE